MNGVCAQEQSGRELAPSGATTRTEDAAFKSPDQRSASSSLIPPDQWTRATVVEAPALCLRRSTFSPVGDAFGCLSHVFGLLTLFAGGVAALFGLRASCLVDLSLRLLDALDDGLGFLIAECLQDCRKELLLLVAHMLLERAPQLSQPVDELVAILRHVLQLEQQLSGQLVVIQRVGHERLRLLILPQDGENVLLLKPRQQFKLFLEVGKEALAGLQRSEGLFAKLRKKFIGFRWTVLNQLSDRGHCASGGDRQPALCVLPFHGEVGFWGRSDASEPTAINGSEKARPATQHPCTTRLSNRSSVQLTTRRCSRAHVPTRSRGHACAIYEFSSASGAALRAGSRSRGPASRSRHLCRDPP